MQVFDLPRLFFDRKTGIPGEGESDERKFCKFKLQGWHVGISGGRSSTPPAYV